MILGIDPGSEISGWVLWDADRERVLEAGNTPNAEMLGVIERNAVIADVVIEKAEIIGQSNIQQQVLETCVWTGRFVQEASSHAGSYLLGRRAVKKELLGRTNMPGADKQIKLELVARYGEPGTKNAPGNLYGVTRHAWQALAVAVAFNDLRARGEL